MSIAEFLEARISEDEVRAKHRDVVTFGSERRKFANDALHDPHDPARVLAECAAKRAIIAEHAPIDVCDAHDANYETTTCDTLRALAAVYKDHPDYQQEWAS